MNGDESQLQTWFAGLPAIERIDLSTRDITRLRRIAIRRRSLGWFLVFALPSLIAVTTLAVIFNGWFLAQIEDESSPAMLGILALAVMTTSLVFLVSIPVALVFAREAFRRARLARLAILRGRFVRCSGPIEDLILDRSAWKKLETLGLLREPRIEIDVLEDSELLWRVGPVEVEPWVEVRKGVTTETPEHAWIASRWTRPTEPGESTVHYRQRRLSQAEISELATCIPQIGLTRFIFVVALNALAAWRLFDLFVLGTPPLEPTLVSILALWADVEVARFWARRHRFVVDVDEGWVALVRISPELGGDENGDSFAEFLPESGAEWTVDGIPAGWRRVFRH